MNATLRDLQKALASACKPEGRLSYEMRRAAEKVADLSGVRYRMYFLLSDAPRLRPVVDRLVAHYGPKAEIEEVVLTWKRREERPKGTDEVHEATTCSTNDAHGGDSCSGEVPEGNSQSGEETSDSRQVVRGEESPEQVENKKEEVGDQGQQRGLGTADPRAVSLDDAETEQRGDAEETGNNSTPQVETSVHKAQGPFSTEMSTGEEQQPHGGEPEEDQLCEKRRAADDAQTFGASAGKDAASTNRTIDNLVGDMALVSHLEDNPKQVGEEEAGDTSEKTPAHQLAKAATRRLAKLVGSQKSRNVHGGITADLRRARIEPTVVFRVQSILVSWIADGGQEEQSQRWDYPQLAMRLLTHRSPYPARKEELGRPILLILADVSGSCAGFSHQSLLVAKAIATTGMPGCDVLVVSHSNGYPESAQINGKPLPATQFQRYKAAAERAGASYKRVGAKGNVAFYSAMLAEYQATHVIALGDHDAVDVYSMLAESQAVEQLIWLNNYNCNWQEPRVSQSKVVSQSAHSKIVHVIGCKDANAFLKGLQIALSK